MKKQIIVAASSAFIISIFAVAAYIYQTNSEISSESLLVRDYSPTLGNQNAKVTIVEFFDPACGTCKSFHPFIKYLMDSNPGKIKLVLRYTPLHQGSDEVVKILEAAKLQNKFWETLEEAYISQDSWAIHHIAYPEKLWKILSYTSLDVGKAKLDSNSLEVLQRIQQDIADAKKLNVTKTPGFFVNGKPLTQFGSEQLRTLVDSAIQSNYSQK